MNRTNVIAVTATEAKSHGQHLRDNGDAERDVMVEIFRRARRGMFAPSEDEAFIAGVAAITEVYPERTDVVHAEARAIGDRSKLIGALADGIPVDMSRVELSSPPEDAVGLLDLFRESE